MGRAVALLQGDDIVPAKDFDLVAVNQVKLFGKAFGHIEIGSVPNFDSYRHELSLSIRVSGCDDYIMPVVGRQVSFSNR